ncbi:MAG: hypothetical protein IPM97_16920 [Bdellovibrionaceae bacterium]|nr:hypothetical protein [Pseudobdellovibrionaceae bacterium]
MIRFVICTTSLLICYFIYGFYISQYEINIIRRTFDRRSSASEFYDYRGIINVHSDISIGSSSPAKIAEAAKNAGIDFLILTDLNAFEDSIHNDSYSQGVLFLNGAKYSYLDSRLIFYSPNKELAGKNLGETQIRFADMLTQGEGGNKNSLLLLAHPFHLGFSWSGDFPTGFDGIELINLKALSVQAWQRSKASVAWSSLIYPFNPSFALARLFVEPSDELAFFDKVSQNQHLLAYAGAEASARAFPWSNYLVKFPSYQSSFEIVTNHVLLTSELTGNLAGDRNKIFNALKKGQFYIAFDALGDPNGFISTIEDRGKVHMMGSRVKLTKGLNMKVKVPNIEKTFYEVIVYKNGERYKTINEAEFSFVITEPGTYRVQVRVAVSMPLPDANRWITWIYGNPFFVTP